MTTETNPATAAPSAPAADVAAEPHRAILPIVLSGVFMTTLDFFIVNVAIPSTQADLNATASAIEWVVAGFGLAYGVGLITGGRLGDLYGRRKMFLLGLALFTIASLFCGIATSGSYLVAARVGQGVSAALLAPQVLAILGTVYTGAAKLKVFTGYGLAMGLAAVFGQLIGGLLIQADIAGLGWRSCFLVNLPIGAAIIALTLKYVPETRAPGKPKLDLVGVAVITLALVALVLPLIEGREKGWPLWTWLSFAASAVLFVLFALQESRLAARGGSPLVNLSLFKERAFNAGLLSQLVFWMGQASFFLVFALYVQRGRGLDALQAGLLFAAIGAGYMYTSMNAGKFAAKLGRQVIAVGALLMGAGLVVLGITASQIGTTGHILWLIPGLVIDGAGMGLAVAPLASTVLARVSPQYAGAASGVLTTALQIGNALGVSIIGIIFYNALGDTPVVGDYPHAFDLSVIFLVGVAVVLAALVQMLPRGNSGK
ncbi:MFS transporter [Kitasatospora sp. NPDC048540]|uniref:MFS transporter n=1 Tax=unclassified Kitasatospora TaxID=2633591 RepID=UPI0009E773D5|nr:MFS transporter [Kitasatospora sp. MBT63]